MIKEIVDKVCSLVPVRVGSIEDFVVKMRQYDCKSVYVVTDCSYSGGLVFGKTHLHLVPNIVMNWLDYVGKGYGVTVKLRQEPVALSNSETFLNSGLLAKLTSSYKQELEENLAFIRKEVPGVEVHYDTHKTERKDPPCRRLLLIDVV